MDSLIGVYIVCHSLDTLLYVKTTSHLHLTKPTKWPVRPAKTQISLGIRPVWSESLLCAQWVAKDPVWSESSLGAHVILLVLSCGSHCLNLRIITAMFSGVRMFFFFIFMVFLSFFRWEITCNSVTADDNKIRYQNGAGCEYTQQRKDLPN